MHSSFHQWFWQYTEYSVLRDSKYRRQTETFITSRHLASTLITGQYEMQFTWWMLIIKRVAWVMEWSSSVHFYDIHTCSIGTNRKCLEKAVLILQFSKLTLYGVRSTPYCLSVRTSKLILPDCSQCPKKQDIRFLRLRGGFWYGTNSKPNGSTALF